MGKISDRIRYIIIFMVIDNVGYRQYQNFKYRRAQEKANLQKKHANLLKRKRATMNRRQGRLLVSYNVALSEAERQSRAMGVKRIGDGMTWDPEARDSTGVYHFAPGNRPTDVASDLKFLYRDVRDCKTHEVLYKTKIYLYNGYGNYSLSDRYQSQCVTDGTADTYYYESRDPIP